VKIAWKIGCSLKIGDEKMFALYDFDTEEFITTRTFVTYQEAVAEIDPRMDNVIAVEVPLEAKDETDS